MRVIHRGIPRFLLTAAVLGSAAPAMSQDVTIHRGDATPEWREAPSGAAFHGLYGDPVDSRPFAFLMRMPSDWTMPPHYHDTAEYLTVLSGTLHMTFEPNGETVELPPGSVIAIPAGVPMWAQTGDEETIIEVAGTGPFRTIPADTSSLVVKARAFRSLLANEDYDAARAMMAPDPRRWWEAREGEGETWTIGQSGGPWADWDRHFRSRSELLEWREEPGAATAVVRETNEYFTLLERGWVTTEIRYTFNDAGRIEGLLIRAVGERPPGRTDEFLAWAREHDPGELEALMPGGEIDPAGDHAPRFRRLLNRWRRAMGLEPIE